MVHTGYCLNSRLKSTCLVSRSTELRLASVEDHSSSSRPLRVKVLHHPTQALGLYPRTKIEINLAMFLTIQGAMSISGSQDKKPI